MKKTFVTLLIALSASAHGYAQTSSEAVSKAERNTIRQGNEYFEKGNYAKALEAYETALRLNTTSQVATYNKAHHYDAIIVYSPGDYFNPALYITQEIVDGLNAAYKKSAKTDKDAKADSTAVAKK